MNNSDKAIMEQAIEEAKRIQDMNIQRRVLRECIELGTYTRAMLEQLDEEEGVSPYLRDACIQAAAVASFVMEDVLDSRRDRRVIDASLKGTYAALEDATKELCAAIPVAEE